MFFLNIRVHKLSLKMVVSLFEKKKFYLTNLLKACIILGGASATKVIHTDRGPTKMTKKYSTIMEQSFTPHRYLPSLTQNQLWRDGCSPDEF